MDKAWKCGAFALLSIALVGLAVGCCFSNGQLGRIHVTHFHEAWSLFKRGLTGIHHFVSAEYLQDCLDESAFRGSHREERETMLNLFWRAAWAAAKTSISAVS